MNPNYEERARDMQRKREEEHQGALERVKCMRVVSSYGDQPLPKATQEMQNKFAALELAGYSATENGIEALERLIHLTETRSSGQIAEVAKFLAAVWGVTDLHMDVLKGLDEDIGADMIAVLNAIRWNRLGVYAMAVDARKRVPAVLKAWGLWPDD
jgi:hypothetical protein